MNFLDDSIYASDATLDPIAICLILARRPGGNLETAVLRVVHSNYHS